MKAKVQLMFLLCIVTHPMKNFYLEGCCMMCLTFLGNGPLFCAFLANFDFYNLDGAMVRLASCVVLKVFM